MQRSPSQMHRAQTYLHTPQTVPLADLSHGNITSLLQVEGLLDMRVSHAGLCLAEPQYLIRSRDQPPHTQFGLQAFPVKLSPCC